MAHLSVTAVCFILVLVPLVAAWPPNFHNWFADICDNRALLNANAYAQSFVANTTLSTVYSVHGIGTVFYPKPTPAAGIGGPTVSRGIIFLPEVCVDPIAYAPHLSVVNTDGYIAILLDPTGVDDDDYQRAYGKALAAMDLFGPQIQYWAVGGHGRAAALASRIAQAAYPKVKGLYLLAGAIDDDVNLSSLYMTVAVIYGTADTVIPASTILATKSRLPDHAYFQAIPGAGHSDFGFYDGWRDPGCGASNQTAVMAILSAPCTNAVVPTGPAIVRVVLQGLHIPKVMPEALAYACNSDLCDYVYVPGRYYAFVPKNTASIKTGLVYHVGAFCDSRAYFPAMRAIADKGFVVVIPIFPLNYVLSNITLTTDVVNDFPYITRWVSSGHSLGVVAAGYIGFQNPTKFVGMLFHDSAPRTNVSTYPGPIAITYGAKPGTGARLPTDSLLYTAYVAVNKLPKSTQFYPIEGGNHYQFGWYNDQPGMPPASISRQVQTQLVVESALMFLLPWFNLP